jgi:hypothetical protein
MMIVLISTTPLGLQPLKDAWGIPHKSGTVFLQLLEKFIDLSVYHDSSWEISATQVEH